MDEEITIKEIKSKIIESLKKVYREDPSLIEKYDICEMSIMHRFAFYLQNKFSDYWMDCEFNKQCYQGKIEPKKITSLNGNYVDIIIHSRSKKRDFLCFELKKEGNNNKIAEDREELKILTSCKPGSFQYEYGFLIILAKEFNNCKFEIYEKGQKISSFKILEL